MINRTEAPKVIVPSELNILHFNTIKSVNNIDLHYINSGSQDVIRVSLVFKAGVKYQDKDFQASATVNMLSEGTKSYNSEQFAEKVDFHGIYLDQTIDRDDSIITMCCLKRFLNEGLEVLSEALLYPVFPQKEFDIYKNKRRQAILIEREKVNVLARELFLKTLFGEKNAYGSIGSIENFDKLTIDDIKSFYNKHYCAENCFAVVSGKIESDDLDKINTLLTEIKSVKLVDYCVVPPESKKSAFLVKDKALQSSIRVGKVLFNKEHSDFISMQVLTTVLGGYFSSRLVKNLREDKGYTYGISSMMINLEDNGYFAITTEVATEYTKDSIDQIYYEIDILTKELIPNTELEMVKNVMIGEMLRVLDGPFGINDVSIENIQNNTDNSYLSKMMSEIKELTNERLLEVAQKYLQRDSFTTIFVGDDNIVI